VTKGLLARLGCDVTTVGSGRDALLMLSQPSMTTMGQPPFAMLFVDIFMPEMDGFEVAVRAEELFPVRSRRPLIIAVTASTDPSVREHCFSVGMDGILLKPFSLEKLRSMLNELLDRGLVKRALQERPDD
jgi:ethylene receptor